MATLLDTSDPEAGSFEPLQSLQGMIDDRLRAVNFRIWTKVPISNELAALMMSLYFEIDHPWCPLFDADLFLNDCVQETSHFCSSLLVNALLAWACVSPQPKCESLPGRRGTILNAFADMA